MPNIDLDGPYKYYIDRMIESGLYKTTAEVVKDALRLHMNTESKAKYNAYVMQAIEEGEADIRAGRTIPYSRELLEQWTQEAMDEYEQEHANH